MPRWRGYRVFGQPTPNDLWVGGQRIVRGWWISNNGGLALPYGSVAVSEAVIDPLADWAPTNVTPTAGQTDPLDGSDAYLLTESSDVSPAGHSFNSTNYSNSATTWNGLDVWLKAAGRNWLLFTFGSTGTWSGYLQIATGTTANLQPDITATLVESVGDWHHWRLFCKTIPNSPSITFYSVSGGYYYYTGDGRDAFYIYLPATPTRGLIQPRASAVADESLLPTGSTKRGADLVKAAPPNQPLFSEYFEALGHPVVFSENGRTVFLSTTHADVLAVVNGDDPVFAVCGVGRMTAPTEGIFYGIASGGGGNGYCRLRAVGADVQLARFDGSTIGTVTWVGAAAAISSAASWALIGSPGRTWELWIGGSYQGSGVIADTSNISYVDFRVAFVSAAEAALAEMTLLAGQIPGADPAARYEFVRAVLKAMADRWEGLPA